MTEHRLEPAALTKPADVDHTVAYGAAITTKCDVPEPFDQTRLKMRWTTDDSPGFTDTKAANVKKTSVKTSVKMSVKLFVLRQARGRLNHLVPTPILSDTLFYRLTSNQLRLSNVGTIFEKVAA